MRVLKVAACPFPYPRGTPVRIYNLAAALAERGHEVHVATYHLGVDTPEAPFGIHRTPRFSTYRKTSPGPSYAKLAILDPMLIVKVRRMLGRHSWDVIHAHHFEGLLVAAAARSRRGPPIVFDSHTLLESELPHYGMGLPQGLKRWIGRWLDLKLPGRADHVVAVTTDMRERMIESGSVEAEDISVIPNGVELGPFEFLTAPSPVPLRTKRVIFTGNLAPYQGIELLLDAFRVLRDLGDDVVLDVVTEDAWDPYAAKAALLGIEEHIEVHSVGFESVPRLLAAADVALNPRVDCDGVPQKVLNYMAAGKPIVSFAGSAKHVVDGVHGLVVPDSDAGAFARAIHRLLGDAPFSNALGEAGRDLVRSELSWDHAAAQVETVYERLL